MRKLASLCLLSLFLSTSLYAQEERPRILLVFDTSGSMGIGVNTRLDTNGDNSVEYPGTGDTSRLSAAKRAIQSVVETTPEAEFALMRYPQLEASAMNTGEAAGFRFNAYAGLEDNPLNYAGVCTGQLRGATREIASSLLVPFAPGNDLAISRWLDHRENYPRNRELRATGPTPIAEALRLAQSYFEETLRADQGLACRQNVVVLLTDGSESCIPADRRADALIEATNNLRSLVIEQDGLEYPKDVRVFVLAFAVNQTAINQLSLVARAGGTAIRFGGLLDLISGEPYQATDFQSLREAFGRILTEAIPAERCNGQDDDCDGRIDEGVLNQCGECGDDPDELCNGLDEDCDRRIDEGVLNACGLCGATPEEVCNEIDDDCDGLIDEAVVNACGGCAGVSEEVCNGIDDDCDGRIDNIAGTATPLERPCGRDLGACTSGLELCIEGAYGTCSGVSAINELCNGRDDDCDGIIDEAFRACGPAVEIGDIGECRVGQALCGGDSCSNDPNLCDIDGFLIDCVGAMGPSDEVCDGRDNDCDGEADEGLFNACGTCGPLPPEACNGRDDNCDGRIDEDAFHQVPLFRPNAFCRVGLVNAASQTCSSSSERFCHPRPCDVISCPPGKICEPSSGQCDDPCRNVECPEDELCVFGDCTQDPCGETGCSDDAQCIEGDCVFNDCSNVTCAADQFCRDGLCINACLGIDCPNEQVCIDGACVADPCDGRCYRGTRCDETDGRCVLDSCASIDCPTGTACERGSCRTDAACARIECPLGTVCLDGTCTDRRVSSPPNYDPIDQYVRPDLSIPNDLSFTMPDDAGTGQRLDAESQQTQRSKSDGSCSAFSAGTLRPTPSTVLFICALALFRQRRRVRPTP